MADPISGAVSSSSATSRYPVDERFPINPLSAADCESSVASELSIGPPIEWVTQLLGNAEGCDLCVPSPSPSRERRGRRENHVVALVLGKGLVRLVRLRLCLVKG